MGRVAVRLRSKNGTLQPVLARGRCRLVCGCGRGQMRGDVGEVVGILFTKAGERFEEDFSFVRFAMVVMMMMMMMKLNAQCKITI